MTWRGNSQKTKPDKVWGIDGRFTLRLICLSTPRMPPDQTTNHGLRSQFSGGSLGWKPRGSLHGDFEKVAYELEPSTTANPKCKFLISLLQTTVRRSTCTKKRDSE